MAKMLPPIDWAMNAEEQTLNDMRRDAIIDAVKKHHEGERNGQIDMSAIENTLSPGNNSIAPTLFGVATGAGALYAGGKMLGGNFPTHLGTHAMNFLEGFYQPGANKNVLYAKELSKALGRMTQTMANPREAIAYANTGISRLIESKIDLLDDELKQIDKKYLEGEYGEKGKTSIDRAKKAKAKILKERHYKVLNDAANRELFDTKISKGLTDYRMRKGTKNANPWWDYDKTGKGFLKSAGDKEVANYLTSRHKVGHGNLPLIGSRGHKVAPSVFKLDPLYGFSDKKNKIKASKNLKYIKWFDNSISGVLHGAQFNYKTYELLNHLKHNVKNMSEAILAITDSGHSFKELKDGRLLINFSPSIKSNFDWGGYNATAEWNLKGDRTKVRFHATDLRDTPVSSAFKGNHVLNYVKSKEMDIKDMKKHIDEETVPNFDKVKRGVDKQKRAPKLSDLQKRQAILDSGELEFKGMKKNIKKGLDNLNKVKKTSKKKLTVKNIAKSALRRKRLPKNVLSYLARAGGLGLTAAGLIGLAGAAFGDD